jgi:hypothetical protein
MVILKNRAKMSTSTIGTGTITLGSAEDGYQTFADAGVVNSDVVRYVIEDGSNWEIGTGTYTTISGTTLSRTVSESSNSNNTISLSGSATVFIGATAEDIPALYAENYDGTSLKPTATGTNAVSIGPGYATGDYSFAVGIVRNSTSYGAVGEHSIAMGEDAIASDLHAIGIGKFAKASSTESLSIGSYTDATNYRSAAIGYNAQAVGTNAIALTNSYAGGGDSFAAAIATRSTANGAKGAFTVAMGRNATSVGVHSRAMGRATRADGPYSVVLGAYGDDDGIGSRLVFGINGTSSGKQQMSFFTLEKTTSNATATVMGLSDVYRHALENNSAHAFHGTIVARQEASQGTACAAWKVEGLIRREADASTTVLVNSATTVLDNTPNWGMALTANTTRGGLEITCTGAASTDIRWVATIHTSEVTYA